jgi:hypothetical protein
MSKRAKPAKPPKVPHAYSTELADAICERIAACEAVGKICQEEGMPARRTLDRWQHTHEEFRIKLAMARQLRADARGEKIDELIAKVEAGKIDPQAARVAIDALKWVMSKENPGRYGDRVELGGKNGGPIQIEHQGLTDLEAARRLTLMLFEQVTAVGGSDADVMKLLNGSVASDDTQ